MIAAALAAAAALVAAFQPPLDRPLSYTVTDDFVASVHSRIVRHETLRFVRTPSGYAATLVVTAQEIESPPDGRDALQRLLGGLVGVPTTIAVGLNALPGAPIDAEPAWAAFVASRRALLAKIDAAKDAPPAAVAAGRAAIAAEIDPPHRDDRLREPFLALLPPAMPDLPGGSRAFAGPIETPAGALPAKGEASIVATTPAAIAYRVTLRTGTEAGDSAAAKLRASLPAAAPPERRARVERAAAALAGSAFSETTDMVIDRPTGLLRASRIVRETIAADGARHTFATREVRLEP